MTPPVALTALVGRQDDLERLAALTSSGSRLITLTGPPGVGKTRLATAFAAKLSYPTAFVDLTATPRSDLVLPAIAHSLGLRRELDLTLESLVNALTNQTARAPFALLLDNLEHLPEATEGIVDLLIACPQLRVIATSRSPLRAYGEVEYRVSPLGLPDVGQVEVEELRNVQSVALFMDRAREAGSELELTPANAAAVAEICRRLDGLPLAIELAAARTKVLAPRGILERLDERLDLRDVDYRGRHVPHRSLRETIALSYDRLEQSEKVAFRRMAVFRGGATQEASFAVVVLDGADLTWVREVDGRIPSDYIDVLGWLLDNNLIRQRPGADGEPIFVMLETIREFGEEVLASAGELEQARRAHASYFLRIAEEAHAGLSGHGQIAWIDTLDDQSDNIRAALEWCLSDPQSPVKAGMGVVLAGAMAPYWQLRGNCREGMRFLARALSLPHANDSAGRARALNGAGNLALVGEDYGRSITLLNEGLAEFRLAGDRQGIATSLSDIGLVHFLRGEMASAARFMAESIESYAQLSDSRGTALALNNLGLIAQSRRQHARAERHFEHSLRLLSEVGDERGSCWSMVNLGDVALETGRQERAASLYAAALVAGFGLGGKSIVAASFDGLGGVAAARGEPEAAATLFAVADHTREAAGAPSPRYRRRSLRPIRRSIEDSLRPEAYEAAARRARTMAPEEAVSLARTFAPPDSGDAFKRPMSTTDIGASRASRGSLTERESEVVIQLALGRSNREIAEALAMSEGTARRHVENILGKLDLHRRAEITAWAYQTGQVDLDTRSPVSATTPTVCRCASGHRTCRGSGRTQSSRSST